MHLLQGRCSLAGDKSGTAPNLSPAHLSALPEIAVLVKSLDNEPARQERFKLLRDPGPHCVPQALWLGPEIQTCPRRSTNRRGTNR